MYGNQERSGSIGDYAAKTEAPRPTELQQLAEAIERSLKSSQDACQAVAHLRDRLFGDRPQAGEKGVARPVRGGIVGGLQDRADDLNANLDRLHALLSEVTRIA